MTLSEIDLNALTYAELGELKGRADESMQEIREQGLPALRERFIQEAAALGITLDEVAGVKKRGRPRQVTSVADHDTAGDETGLQDGSDSVAA